MNHSFYDKILLASSSPRRVQLLTQAGFDVRVLKGLQIDERYPDNLPINEIPKYLSALKAKAYATEARQLNLPLVAADTIVVLDGNVIGKPKNVDEAKRMLELLSGNWHTVISGVTLIVNPQRTLSFSEITKVKFDTLSKKSIDYYVENFHPLDKAGSYGIQEWIGLIGVERIEGDFYNIMGFPINKFVKIYLSEFHSFV